MNYEVVLYFENGVWVAEAPELPGCACHAATEEEALAQIKSLIPEWLDAAHESGTPVPQPVGRHAFA